MPELPEVEIAARNLRAWIGGKKIVDAKFAPTRIIGGVTPAAMRALVVGRSVKSIDRRGKWLRVSLSGGATLFSHLGMTGKWVRRACGDGAERFEKARLDSAHASVRYTDPRLFGRLYATPGASIPQWDELGPDPLVDGLDARRLAERLAKVQRTIKEALMDQAIVAGVGNIQAAEALWRARVNPEVPASRVTPAQMRAIVRGIEDSIELTLAGEEGPDDITYVEEPGADNPFNVYGKQDEPCPRCGKRLKRIVQGGRSTVYCPGCQPRSARRTAGGSISASRDRVVR
jgi:formamidopyrimidine-DNA glycosylase